MTNEKQVAIDALWEKYAKMLEMNISLLDELEKKPKEVEVIVEVEALLLIAAVPLFHKMEFNIVNSLQLGDVFPFKPVI